MAKPTDELEPEPKSWNIWLTLMVISIAFSIAVAVLEYVGVFHDLGVILSAVGLALALGFGISGSSQRTVELVRFDLRGIRRDLTRGFAEMSREMNLGLGRSLRCSASVSPVPDYFSPTTSRKRRSIST